MNITVYLGSNAGKDPKYAAAVKELGRWIGSAGHSLVYGGSRAGLMGMLADAVLDGGGAVTGVEPQMFIDAVAQHEGISRLIVTPDMSERKAKMIELGDAFIAFPGGTGTLEEIAEILSRKVLGLDRKPCIIYNLDHYYDLLEAQLEHMREEGFLDPMYRRDIHFAADLAQIEALLTEA